VVRISTSTPNPPQRRAQPRRNSPHSVVKNTICRNIDSIPHATTDQLFAGENPEFAFSIQLMAEF
jgi:hypothetical protein